MSDELILTEEDQETFVPRDHDWLLLQLVNWAKLGIETGVTLCVGGQLVSGTLCSQKQYLEAMRSAFSANLKGSQAVAGALDEAFASMLKSTAETDSLPQPNPKYIHLKDARVFGGATAMPTAHGVWWRGRIAEVDGFHLGALKSA
ncbi:gas vesicle accessory protein GvpU [Sphingosinicella rhizophila]|uniref:Gas vesicle accessory protein GvpU n=1 Tax=Sphingosinicella rhizophila TaxID=3050082 RepID=A0ABU3Q7D6_9SPHN|nr:gas vesicle accessory protein GvpU [Sphingosinicella sp. GR2756]MDT9599310.1 gas vesicle accessory protein GvpU [Sphingosinicella sp. GR2756]